MSKRKIWGVSTGSYSDYCVLALFDDETDAIAVAAGQVAAYVEEFDCYAPGDRSLRNQAMWTCWVKVTADGKLGDPVVRGDIGCEDDSDLDSGHVAVYPAGYYEPTYVLSVVGKGRTEEQAVKGAKDRAAQVAAQLLEGFDPREVIRGEPSKTQLAADWERALHHNKRFDELATQRRNLEETARKAAEQFEHYKDLEVAVFDHDRRISEWTFFMSRMAFIPVEYPLGDTALELRTKHDVVVLTPWSAVSVVAGEELPALVWSLPRALLEAQ